MNVFNTHSVQLQCAIHTKDMNCSHTMVTVLQNRIKESQSHSHNIAPCERVLNNAMQLISNCNQIVHPKNRVLHFCSNCIFRDLWKDCFVEYILKLHCDKEDKDVFHHEEHVFPHVSSSDIKHVCVKIPAINAWRSRSLHTHAFLTPAIKLREIIYFFLRIHEGIFLFIHACCCLWYLFIQRYCIATSLLDFCCVRKDFAVKQFYHPDLSLVEKIHWQWT